MLRALSDVFSKRDKQRPQNSPDVISEGVRNRTILLYREVFSGKWTDSTCESPGNYLRDFWEQMHNALQHAYGRFQLSARNTTTAGEDVLAFVMTCPAAEFFDFLELTFHTDAIWRVLRDENHLVDAINEILTREAAPFQLTSIVKREEPARIGRTIRTVAWPKIVRVEDEVTFVEAVEPALTVLSHPDYEAANAEFRGALDDYRKGRYDDCLVKCGSSFESVLKVLCQRNKWPFNQSDRAAPLLRVVLSRTKLDPFFKQPLTLIATMRNELSAAHGGGTVVRSVEPHVAQFAITSTAAAVVLLVREVGP